VRILGVDPGAGGALALLEDDQLRGLHDRPVLLIKRGKREVRQANAPMLASLLRSLMPIDLACVELVGAMPGQGVSSCFAFGRDAGMLEGALAGLGVPLLLVPPVVWKREMGVNSSKDSSRHRALQLWPAWAREFARVKDDGRAEAALLGLYGLRKQVRQGGSTTPSLSEALAAL
jgi:crossover junction endodeoxyribonuclease RuvC